MVNGAEDRADVGEPPGVLIQLEPQVGDRAVASAADGDLLQLGAPVAEAGHRLAAGLLEPHRPAHLPRQYADQQFLAVAPDLGAEPTADVGRQDPHLIGLDPCGRGDRIARALRVLGRQPHVQAPVDPRRRATARLERARRDALVHDALVDDDLAALEELRTGVRRAAHGHRVEHCVAAGGLVDVGVARQRLLEIDQHRQRIDVGDDRLGGVGGLLVRLGDDRRDRLADPPHLVGRQQRAGDAGVERRRLRFQRQG